MTYRVGVIGCGRMGSTIDDEVQGNASVILPFSHTAAYMEEPRVHVVAAADVGPDKRAAYRRRWDVERVYESHTALLEREKLDIVSVCTRAEERPDVVIACAEAGVKVIYAEKPLAWTLGEAEAMVAACRRNGVKLGVGCLRRWHPFYRKAKQLIDEGAIGRRAPSYGVLCFQPFPRRQPLGRPDALLCRRRAGGLARRRNWQSCSPVRR